MRRNTPWILAASLATALAVVAATPPANLPDAIAAQRQLVAAAPGDGGAQNDLGNLLVLAGELAAAEEAYRRAVEVEPGRADWHYNLALLLIQRDKPERALDALHRVVELEPGNAWAVYQVGAVHEKGGNRGRAVEWYGRAFRLDQRLAFPDVNPAVIDSELTAEAMLRGYREGALPAVAPRVYEEPGRISALLVMPSAPPPEEGRPEVMETPEEMVAGERVRGGGGQARPLPPGVGERGGDEPRVLTGDDLGGGAINQAEPAGVPEGRGAGAGRRGRQVGVAYPGAIGYPQETATEDPQGRGQAPGDPAPDGGRIDPRTGRPFRPGLPSTGRLDLILVDPRTERPA